MKLKFEIIYASETADGDIFYCTPCSELNEHGPHFELSGTDQIFIRDDYYDHDEDNNYGIAVNGGNVIWFKPKEKVVRLAHYGDLIRIMEMVQKGNPDMEVGPNDFMTKLNDYLEANPEQADNLFNDFDLDINFD